MEDKQGQEVAPELNLDLDSKKLAFFIESYEEKYAEFEKDHHLVERRERNKKYLFGQQLSDKRFKKYDLGAVTERTVDNIIKDAEDILRPLVLSRMPDIIINPGSDSQIPRETADTISEAINKTLHSDELKKILTKAFRRHSMDLTAVIKYYWKPDKGKMGDIEWEVIPAKYIKVDSSATDNDQKNMRMIIHEVNKTLNEWLMLFPGKEEELKKFALDNDWKEGEDEDGIAFELKVKEVWFDWKEKEEDFDPEDPKFKFYSGVLWKAGKGEDSILDKRLNPNWDWDGEEQLFMNGQPIPSDFAPQLAMLGTDIPGVERKKVYRNYFGKPRKPFIFMGYEQYGEQPFDEISRIEENRFLQDNYDIRMGQIHKMIDEARGKHVFSGLSGLKKETIEEMDLNDPDEDIYVEGELSKVHGYITKEQPSAQMFNDLSLTGERVKQKYHVSGAASGELTSDVATTNQIQRESSFTSADDISDLMINDVAMKMAEALLHMMKLRYTEDHFKALVGSEGEEAQMRFTQDIIEDGMEVAVKTSGTDKLKRERQAKEEAELGLIDPVSYFQDTGRDDPEHRAEMAFLWNTAPELYYKQVIQKQDVSQIAGGVIQQNQQNLAQAQGQTQPPAIQPSPQQPGNIPQGPSGSAANLVGRASGAIGRLFGR